jgi:predicted acetyltransferase
VVRAAEVELGGVDEHGLRSFVEAFDATFGATTDDASVERFRRYVELDRLVVARNPAGEIVGTSGAYSFDIALPLAGTAPCAGITVVSVRGDHRRRGVLTRMMVALLDQAAERGEPFAALWASEAPIYGRYGFGPAAPAVSIQLERPHAALRLDGPVDEVRFVGLEEASATFPAIYEEGRRQRPGGLSRSPAWWGRVLDDEPSRRDGAGPVRYALLPGRGYAVHRLRPSWDRGAPSGTVEVLDLVALDAEARAALWRLLIDTDLAAQVRVDSRPADEPLLAMLVDPGRATVDVGWPLFVRLVDLPAALEARGYAGDDELVLEVSDATRPVNAGRWRLVARGGRGTCEHTDAPPDLSLDTEALATVVLGGVRTTTLVAAGQVVAVTGGAAGRLDRLFASEAMPWHGGMF